MRKALITNRTHAELRDCERERVRRAMAGEEMEDADYILNYADPADAYRAVTPERFRLLQVLQRLGTVSIYALARELGRNYSNVHADVLALLELELVARTPDGVFVPWAAVEWRLSTAARDVA